MNATTDTGAWARPGAPERSPEDLEREGEQIRANLDRTLDEIERKLSPGELLDRSVEFMRTNGGEFIREAGETIRNNPIPVLLTAAGLVWLTTSIARKRGSRASSYYEGEEFASYRGSDYSEDFEDYGHNDAGIRSKVEGTRARVSDAAHRASERVTGTAQDVADRVRGRVSSSMRAMQDRTQDVRSNLMNLVQEQPIAFGALALAVGAVIGAALPMTQYENRLIGPARDRTLARAKELGQREYEHLKETVSSSLERRPKESASGSTQVSNPPPEQG